MRHTTGSIRNETTIQVIKSPISTKVIKIKSKTISIMTQRRGREARKITTISKVRCKRGDKTTIKTRSKARGNF